MRKINDNPRIARRVRRQRGLRKRLFGMPDRPRLCIFRSNKHFYAQLIDDLAGRTIASASTNEKGAEDKPCNCANLTEVGVKLAERAKQAGIEAIVFDRAGFRYHGRVKSFADGARKGGLKF
jgi:large subunit ribosomal protein L18